MPKIKNFFHRREMAEFFAARILSEKGEAGIFLAAQRRTGKSTFIREDLKPLLEAKDVEVIYVDLWTDTQADPGVLISNSIKDHLRQHQGIVSQLIQKSGIEKFSLGGFQINLEKIGAGSGETIARAFEALSQETKRQIVMIIDEAQHSQIVQSDLTFTQGKEVAMAAFLMMSSRPEMLREALDRLDDIMGVTEKNVDEVFKNQVNNILDESKKVFSRFMNSLTPLQYAVLRDCKQTTCSIDCFRSFCIMGMVFLNGDHIRLPNCSNQG